MFLFAKDDAIIELGNSVCSVLDEWNTKYQNDNNEVRYAMLGVNVAKILDTFVNAGSTRTSARAVTAAASSYLCPQYETIVANVLTLPSIAAD